MATMEKLKLKLFIDKEKKKVIFAESNKDFVDILFSFLTMPLGSVIRVLKKQSLLGCMDRLYDSIEQLDECYFSTESCKEMLLRPLNASGEQCEDLILRIDESNPRTFFTCQYYRTETQSIPYFSFIPRSRCVDGHIMTACWNSGKKKISSNADGVFLRGISNFIITDDLVVMPASTMHMQRVFEKYGIEDVDNIEETCIDMDLIKLHDLLKRSLISKFPLSDMYFKTDNVESPQFRSNCAKIEDNLINKESKNVKAKVFVCKSSNKVLYAEAEGGFLNLLFSMLTIPLGSIVKLLDKFSSIGCLDNLYKSVESISSDCKFLKSDVSNLLLHPKLAAHFSYGDSLFSVGEKTISTRNLPDCNICYGVRWDYCFHGNKSIKLTELNPKIRKSAEAGGSYVKFEPKFLITDQLEIKHFSTQCSMQTIKNCKASFAALEEKEIDINELGALKLLKSCLTSQSPLSDVFLSKKRRNRLLI